MLPARRLGPRRIVFEVTVVAVAIAAVVLLRQRGLRCGPSVGLRPAPRGDTGPPRGRDRVARHPPVPRPGPGPGLALGSAAGPRAVTRPALDRAGPGRGPTAADGGHAHRRDRRVLIGGRPDHRERPGARGLAGDRCRLPDRRRGRDGPGSRRRPSTVPGVEATASGSSPRRARSPASASGPMPSPSWPSMRPPTRRCSPARRSRDRSG